MASWLIKRRLSQNSARLASLRAELRQIDEQLDHFRSDGSRPSRTSCSTGSPAS
jgi:hypothetical protein